jgi:ribosomal-protein-alanine N-acetyltransferase
MQHATIIETPRLLLKAITPSFIHDIFKSKSKEEIMTYFCLDEVGYLFILEIHEKGVETHRLSLFYFLVVNKETNEPMGDCGFHTWNASHRRAELFYVLRKDEYKQKGFMKEALAFVLDYGFAHLNLHRIQALIDDNNTPSLKLLQHYQFTKEGIMREDYNVDGKNEDSTCYSLLKHEWMK